MTEVVLSIPTPPSLNMVYRGRRYKTAAYKQWCQDADLQVKIQHPSTISGPVAIKICIERQRGDLDNRVKACLDALVRAGVIDDDHYVEDIHVKWDDEVRGAEVWVRAA